MPEWVPSVLSLLCSAIGGALGAGLWLGAMKAEIRAHIDNTDIHVSPLLRDELMRKIIDREVQPKMDLILRRLDRMEAKIDQLPSSK